MNMNNNHSLWCMVSKHWLLIGITMMDDKVMGPLTCRLSKDGDVV